MLYICFLTFICVNKCMYNIAFQYTYSKTYNEQITHLTSVYKAHPLCSELHLALQIFLWSECGFWSGLCLFWGFEITVVPPS